MEVGNQGYSQAEHESCIQRDLGEAEETDDNQRQDPVEPDHLGAGHEFLVFIVQIVIASVGVFIGQFSSFARGDKAGAAALFHNAHVSGKDDQDNQADTLQGQQFFPQFIDVRVQDDTGTGYRTAPGEQVHDGHGSTDDADQDDRAHMQFLINRKHSRDGDQQGGSQSTVEVGNDSNQRSGDRNHDDVGTGFFNQPVYHRIEQSHIAHHGEVNDGENEEDGCRPGLADTFLDEPEDLVRSESADQGCDDRNNDEQRDRVGFGADQGCDDDDDHRETDNT